MKSDFYTAIAQIAAERGIPREAVLSSVEHALKTVYKKMANTEEEVEVEHRPEHRRRCGSSWYKRVVAEVEDPINEIILSPRRRHYAADAAGRRRDPDRADAGELRPDRRADRQAGRAAADPRLRARHGLRGVRRQARRGPERRRPARRRARGDRRARQGRGGDAGARAGADRALPPGPAAQGLLVEVNKDPRGPAVDRLPLAPEPDPPAVRAGGAGDLQRRGRDHGDRPRAGSALEGRGRGAAGEGRPGRLLRRHPRRPHPEHRQRAVRREDRRHRVVARHGAVHRQRAQPGQADQRHARRAGTRSRR